MAVTFFRLMKELETMELETEAEEILKDLIYTIQYENKVFFKRSKTADFICRNYRDNSSELQNLLSKMGVSKSTSTIRSQQQLYSNYLYDIFGCYDFIYEAFALNEKENLEKIKNTLYAFNRSDFTLEQMSVNLTPLKDWVGNEQGYNENNVDECLRFIKSIDTFSVEERYAKLDKCTLSTIISALDRPLVQQQVKEITDKEGIKRKIVKVKVNEEKVRLYARMRDLLSDSISLTDEIATSKINIQEKVMEKELPFKFLSQEEMQEIILARISQQGPEFMASSGKDATFTRAINFTKLFCNRDFFTKYVDSFNPFDLDAALSQYRNHY